MLEECLDQHPAINQRLEKTKALIEKRGIADSITSEAVVIGSVLGGNTGYGEVDIDPSMFSIDKHKTIWQAIFELDAQGLPATPTHVAKLLEEKKQLGSVGGLSYLVELMTGTPVMVALDHFIQSIQERASALRLISDILDQVDRLVIGADVEAVRSEISQLAAKQNVTKENVHSYGMHDPWEIVGTADNLTRMFAKQQQGILTGIRVLDDATYGLHRKELVIIGARPSDGKTALMTQICANSAEQNYRTHLLSLEMSEQQLMKRICCQQAGISFHRNRIGDTSLDENEMLENQFIKTANMPLKISESVDWTITRIKSHLKYQRSIDAPVDLLAIDYLGLMPITGHNRRERRDLDLGEITRGLKLLAKEFDCCVILLSQLSREGEKNNRKPIKSDLKDSGNIEADADTILMLWHDRTKQADYGRPAEILLEKQRNGPTGPLPVYFMAESTSFVDRNNF